MLFFSNNSSYLLTFLFYIRKKTRNVNKKIQVIKDKILKIIYYIFLKQKILGLSYPIY